MTNSCFKDHSFSHHDCIPYWLRTGDSWTPIDYSKHPSHWMKPLVAGSHTGLVEIPANWYLDDLPPMMFIKKAPNSHGWVNPKDVEELWRDHFDYFYREYDDFCFPVTIHPDVSGHPHVIFMLERLVKSFLISYIDRGRKGIEGADILSYLQIDRVSQHQRRGRMGQDGRHMRRFQVQEPATKGCADACRAWGNPRRSE